MKPQNVLYLGDDPYDSILQNAFMDDLVRPRVPLGQLKAIRFKTYSQVLNDLTAYYFGVDPYTPDTGAQGLSFDLTVIDMGYPSQPDGGLKLWQEMGPNVKAWLARSYVAVLTKFLPPVTPPSKPELAVSELLQLLKAERGAGTFGAFSCTNHLTVVNMLRTVYP